MAEFTTILDTLSVMLRLGIHPHEVEPQRVLITVELTVDYPAPPSGDRIEEVLDYDFIREGIVALAAERKFALQETLCETIVALCFTDARVRRARVRTMKPDVYPDAGVGCEVMRARG